MKNIHLTIFFLFSTLTLFSQEYRKLDNESAQDFVIRVKPKKENRIIELLDKVVETKLWNNSTNVIIAFYKDYSNAEISDYQEFNYVDGYVYVQINPNTYKKIFIDRYFVTNPSFKIESVFFANADNDKSKELCILHSQALPDDAESEGIMYNTVIYDDVLSKKLPSELLKIDDIENGFESLEGKYDDAPYSKAKYKTASAIKKRLKELGY